MIPLMGFCYMLQYMDKVALSTATLFGIREDLVCYNAPWKVSFKRNEMEGGPKQLSWEWQYTDTSINRIFMVSSTRGHRQSFILGTSSGVGLHHT